MPECANTCLDTGTLQAVNNANFKAVSEMALLDTLAHRNRMYGIFESSSGQIMNRMNSLDPTEAAAIRAVSTSHLSEKVAELSAGVGAAMQYIKGGQTTPPISSPQPVT